MNANSSFASLELKACRVMKLVSFDCCAVGVVDFANGTYNFFEIDKKQNSSLFFDLASLTKVLTLASYYLIDPTTFSSDMILLLNHRASLPSWGRLSNKGWREQILNYPIQASSTLYSDFSAMRLMLEIEKVSNQSMQNIGKKFWDKDLIFWKDLKPQQNTPVTGERQGKIICGEVHDDNAYTIDRFCAHAGLFATVEGVARTLINLNSNYQLLDKMEKGLTDASGEQRFINGWDTVAKENSLSGKGIGDLSFGHLGFTGTSVWIDIKKRRGSIILSNATQKYWYNRDDIDHLRKELGQIIWKM